MFSSVSAVNSLVRFSSKNGGAVNIPPKKLFTWCEKQGHTVIESKGSHKKIMIKGQPPVSIGDHTEREVSLNAFTTLSRALNMTKNKLEQAIKAS